MKNKVKLILVFILGIIVSSTISVCAVNVLSSRNVLFTSNNENFKAGNVADALDTLYDNVDVVKVLPVGSVISYMGFNAPDNYLICDGTVYNIADYQKLADHIKNNFGSYNKFGGDGTTTFAVPDLRGEFLRGAGTNSHANQGDGANVGEHTNEGLPNIVGDPGAWGHNYTGSGVSGAFSPSVGHNSTDHGHGNYNGRWVALSFDASRSNAIYGASQHVTPTNTSVTYIIKAK